jgi:hypothetical protein
MQGLDPCISFGAQRPDSVIAKEILAAVQPLAMEAALVAERDAVEQNDERRRAVEPSRFQALEEEVHNETKVASRLS